MSIVQVYNMIFKTILNMDFTSDICFLLLSCITPCTNTTNIKSSRVPPYSTIHVYLSIPIDFDRPYLVKVFPPLSKDFYRQRCAQGLFPKCLSLRRSYRVSAMLDSNELGQDFVAVCQTYFAIHTRWKMQESFHKCLRRFLRLLCVKSDL